DPVMYRIRKTAHHRTGDTWCIYPLYDWAHGQSDSIEGVTHSLCTLEYEDHRPLYDWYIQALGIYAPRQIEFARLNLSHTVMSKRKLLQLVEEGLVSGWEDPRMPTLAGLRRRGYTPEAIRDFCERIGIAKADNLVDIALLEHCLRDAYIVKCTGVERDAAGQVTTVRCEYDPASRGGDARGRKVKGTIHWVSAADAVDAEVRLYDHLFTAPKPDETEDWKTLVNPR